MSDEPSTPRPPRVSEPRAVLEARERENFRRLVLKEAERVADLHRYRTLVSDRRAVRAQLATIEDELKEIAARVPRHLLRNG